MRYGTGVALTLSAAQVDILSHKCCVCVDTKRDHGGQENNSRLSLCGIWGKIWRALGTTKNTKVTLRYGTGVALTLSAAQVDILSHKCCVCVDTKRDHGGQKNNSRLSLCGIWGKIWRALGTKKNTKVTLRYGTGVALTLSAAQVDILSHKCCVCVDTKRDHGGQENNSRLSLCGIWGKIWRALGTTKNTKVTLRYGTGVALTLSAAQVDILSHKCCVCVDTKRDHGGQKNNSRLSLCGIWGKIWRALGTKKNTKVTLQ